MPAKILSEEDLKLYLEIIAEQSVRDAYSKELESFKLFEQGEEEKDEDPLFGGDDEGDEGEDEDPLFGGDDEGDEGSEDPEPEPEPEPEQEPEKKDRVEIRPTPLTLELGQVTSDGLIATLNMIRAGRSFKEPDVAAQLKKYFEDQLNDSERLALATFLSAIRDLTSGTPAEEAPEPDDENVNIDATQKERRQHNPQKRGPSSPALRPTVQQATGRGIEDTSPPIQVGPRSSALAEEYRKHIRSLLS